MVKNWYCRNDGFIFTWNLGVIFLGIPNWAIDGSFLFISFFNSGLKGVIENLWVVS